MERIIAPASKKEEAAMLDAADRVRKCLEGLIRPKGADAIEYEFTQELVSVVQRWAEGPHGSCSLGIPGGSERGSNSIWRSAEILGRAVVDF